MMGVVKLPPGCYFVGMEQDVSELSLPELYIRAVNPGFTVDGQSNVGELIELARTNPDDQTPISLAGIILTYTNSSGNTTELIAFPDDSWMTGENILLRLASSPGSELADLTYTKSLAQKAGPLTLKRNEEILDEICWTGKDECADSFKSALPTTLYCNYITNELSHLEIYKPSFSTEKPSYYIEEKTEEPADMSIDEAPVAPCIGLEFSEILSYYESVQSEQFIELHNYTSEQVLLNNCGIRYKNKTYPLTGVADPDEYVVRWINDFTLTKNPTTKNTVELVDLKGNVVQELTYYNGQKKATSYAKVGYDGSGKTLWKSTYTPTPGLSNIYQQFKPCEEGKVLNEETGNCVKVTPVTETVCKDGYFLNPETGRCNKIKIEEEKECAEGYYLNPLTNRCKKIAANTGADYGVRISAEEQQTSSFVAISAAIALIVVAILFAAFEFRREIQKVFHRLFHKQKQVNN